MFDGRIAKWDQYGSEFDFPGCRGATKTYVIASSGRSGSHFLANLLWQTGRLGCPFEYLHPSHLERWKAKLAQNEIIGVLNALKNRRSSPNGWFGLKAHWPQFQPVAMDAELLRTLDVSAYIRLSRRNEVAQAISMDIAQQTGAWISFHKAQRSPQYDHDGIAKALEALQLEHVAWAEFFDQHEIAPLIIYYEDLVGDPLGTVAAVCNHLGEPKESFNLDFKSSPQKQATAVNVIWEQRFREEGF